MAVRVTAADLRPDQQNDAAETNQKSKQKPGRQAARAGCESIQRNHPERHRGDRDGRDPAWHPLLRPDDTAVANADCEQTYEAEAEPSGRRDRQFATNSE